MRSEHVWPGVSRVNTSGSCSERIVFDYSEHVGVLRTLRGRPRGVPGRSVPAQEAPPHGH
eukprot:6751358-Pyramimonas_sp.AAC.1